MARGFWRLLGLDLLDQLEPVRRVESRAQREQLVERQPQRVDVGPSVPFTPEPLGGHVAERTQDVAALGQSLVFPLGQAEIRDPDHAFGVQQQVRRLDVPVHDPTRMGVGQAPGDLPADLSQAAEERAPTRLDRRELGTAGQDRRARRRGGGRVTKLVRTDAPVLGRWRRPRSRSRSRCAPVRGRLQPRELSLPVPVGAARPPVRALASIDVRLPPAPGRGRRGSNRPVRMDRNTALTSTPSPTCRSLDALAGVLSRPRRSDWPREAALILDLGSGSGRGAAAAR